MRKQIAKHGGVKYIGAQPFLRITILFIILFKNRMSMNEIRNSSWPIKFYQEIFTDFPKIVDVNNTTLHLQSIQCNFKFSVCNLPKQVLSDCGSRGQF